MTTYLTIITTALVITQIIRVTQNTIALQNHLKTDKMNKQLMADWKDIVDKLHEVLDKEWFYEKKRCR